MCWERIHWNINTDTKKGFTVTTFQQLDTLEHVRAEHIGVVERKKVEERRMKLDRQPEGIRSCHRWNNRNMAEDRNFHLPLASLMT